MVPNWSIISILENDEMNVYQTLSKTNIHGERQELEQHILKYQKQAQAAGVTKVHAMIAEANLVRPSLRKSSPTFNRTYSLLAP